MVYDMNADFSNILLISDIDGTLMGPGGYIAPRNLQKLREFTAGKGLFTVASGRSFRSAAPHVARLPMTCPGVHFNGGCIYDFAHNQVLRAHYLPESVFDCVQQLLRDLPFVGICMLSDIEYYYVSPKADCRSYYDGDNVPLTESSLHAVPKRIYKVLLACAPEQMLLLQRYLSEKQYEGIYFVTSSPTYLEIMPQGVTKANGVKELRELLGLQHKFLVTIGDYHNDIPMLLAADWSASPSDAQPQVKQQTAITVCSCLEGAVADVIQLLADKNMNEKTGGQTYE